MASISRLALQEGRRLRLLAVVTVLAAGLATSTLGGAPPARAAEPAPLFDVTVAGHGGVPTSGVAAVVLNVTMTEPGADGFVTVWPAGQPRPLASSLNFTRGQTVANLVIVPLGAGGNISVFDSSGHQDNGNPAWIDSGEIIVDVLGWFPVGGAYTGTSPARLVDTRAGSATVDAQDAGIGAVGPSATLDVTVLGRGGVPTIGVGAVALNVTVADPTSAGYVTVWPTGQPRPTASNVNFAPGSTVPNMVMVPIGANGQVSVYNSGGRSDIVIDVLGWFGGGSGFNGLTSARLLDTRAGGNTIDGAQSGAGPIGEGATARLPIAARGGVPASGAGAVALNITVTDPTADGYLTVWPTGQPQPLASNINFIRGQTIANMVVVPTGDDGTVSIYNSAGSTDVVADVLGWFPSGSSFFGLTPSRIIDTRPLPDGEQPHSTWAFSYAPVAAGIPVPTADPATAIQNALAGLMAGVILSATYSTAPVFDIDIGTHIDVTVDDPHSSSPVAIDAEWQVALLTGAVAEQIAHTPTLHDALPGGFSLSYRMQDGTTQLSRGAGIGYVWARQVFTFADASDDSIKQLMNAILTQHGLTAKSIDVLHALGAAPRIVVAVHSSADLHGQLAQLQRELTGNGEWFPGLFLEIDLDNGTPIAVLETSYRLAEGGQWIAPGYDDLGGPPHA